MARGDSLGGFGARGFKSDSGFGRLGKKPKAKPTEDQRAAAGQKAHDASLARQAKAAAQRRAELLKFNEQQAKKMEAKKQAEAAAKAKRKPAPVSKEAAARQLRKSEMARGPQKPVRPLSDFVQKRKK